MGKEDFYKEQIEAFSDYAAKQPERELLAVFNEWVYSKDLDGVDRQNIWKRVRQLAHPRTKIISDNHEEFIRLSAVLEILLENDLAYVSKLIEKHNQLT
jgi:hypothetical protein